MVNLGPASGWLDIGGNGEKSRSSWDISERNGMTQEYADTIDSTFRGLFNQGIKGDIWNAINTSRSTADNFMKLINSGLLKNENGKIVMDSTAYNDPKNAEIAKLADSFGYVDQVAVTKQKDTTDRNTKFDTGVDSALEGGYITKAQSDALKGAYKSNPDGAQAQLNTWVSSGLEKTGEATVPKWEYAEPEVITQYKDLLQEDLAIEPTFDPETVKKWLPTLLEAQAPAKQQEYQNNAELMNSLGRLYSGQTLGNSQTINNNYTMDALNKALGYAGSDYATQLSTKNAAKDKALALGQYETGISQYQNSQDVSTALQNLMNNWNTINTNKSQNYNDITSAIERVYANEDWTKSADLTKLLASMSDSGSDFDWSKLLQPAATVAAAAI
jgi:hypothetical protein